MKFQYQLCLSQNLTQIFDFLKQYTRDNQNQQFSFAIFASVACKRLGPEHPRFVALRQIFTDYFNTLVAEVPKEQVISQTL